MQSIRVASRHRLFAAVCFALSLGAASLAPAAPSGGGSGEVVEEFDGTAFLDPRSNALWGLFGSGRLVAGTGLGGNGSDGIFVASAPETVLDTDLNGGRFNFSRFVVPAGTRVVFTGSSAARVFVLRYAEVRGDVVLRGGNGEIPIARGQVTRGGAAGPGGARGGNGNPGGIDVLSLHGERGRSVPRVSSARSCNTVPEPLEGGGCPGRRASSGAGSGGGGGHAFGGLTDNPVSPPSGLGGAAYGEPTIADLRGGSGGGGGGNDEDGQPFEQDDPGGAGGGGGGAFGLEVGRMLALSGEIDASGGGGGGGFQHSGAGGGGSGGAIRIRAGSIGPVTSGALLARGGLAGTASPPGRPSGSGSPGRIRLEIPEGVVSIDRSLVLIDPPESQGALDSSRLGRTLGLSRHYDTGVLNPLYAFDGSDPLTGALRTDAAVTDIVLPNGVPAGTTARIVFAGAPEDPANPGFPDLSMEVGPVRDVTRLDGLRFIRFALRFDVGQALPVAVVPEVERLRIRFTCP